MTKRDTRTGGAATAPKPVRLTPNLRRLLTEAANASDGGLRITLDHGHPSTRYALAGHGLATVRTVHGARVMFITPKGRDAVARNKP